MNMRCLAVLSLLVGVVSMSGQAPPTSFKIDLQSNGWKADRGVLKSSWLASTIDFADDGSLWAVFPSESSQPLQMRSGSSGYPGKVLHFGSNGEIIQECSSPTLNWSSVRLFAQRSDGFTLDTDGSLISYDGRCKQRATYPTDEHMGIMPSPNRAFVYTRTRDNRVHVLNGESLASVRELELPQSIGRSPILFGDHVVAYSVKNPTKNCWQSQFSKVDAATGQTTPWVTIDCARFNLLGDDHLVYSDSGGNAPLRITGSDAAYNPPHDFHLDLGVLDGLPVDSPASLRIAEELIETKGRHPSLDISGRFVGRSIVLLDMRTGTALLTVKVPMDSLAYAYALSRDGKRFAVLLNSQLTVFQVP
jgi:hypothetical protein